MAFSKVSSVPLTPNGTSSSINTTSAKLIVAFIADESAASTFSDSQSNTWLLAEGTTGHSRTDGRMLYCINPSTSASHTFTSGNGDFPNIDIIAFTCTGTPQVDTTNKAVASSASTLQAGAVTPSASPALILAGCGFDNGTAAIVATDPGFTVDYSDGGAGGVAWGVALAYYLGWASGAVNPTWSTGASAMNVAVNAVFIEVAGGGGNSISVPAGSLSLTALTPTVTATQNNNIAVPLATMTLSGKVPTVTATANQSIAVPAGSLTLTARVPTIAQSSNNLIAVPAGSLALSALTPTVTATQNNNIAVPAGSLTLSALTPTVAVSGGQIVNVPLGTLTLTGFAPTVTATANNAIAVPAGALTLSAQTPTVVASDNKSIVVPAGSLSLTALTPTVTATANQFVAVPAGSLTINGLTPTVALSDNQFVQVPAGALTMTAIAPSVQASGPQVINVPLGVLSITVYAPTVVNSTPNDQSSGGFWPDYEHIQRQRRKRKREIEEAEEETQRLQDETDREIARLLHEQEQKDADRADLTRLQKLADQYAAQAPTELPKVARVAILNANDARTRNSLEQMQRVIEQSLDDEMLAINQVLLLLE